ncbi:MAG: TIGR02757 family protein, partial [Sphingobacteriaceae bacterium]
TDLLYFVAFFRQHYQNYNSLEDAFFTGINSSVETMLNHFRSYFFSLPDFPRRTIKHVSSPQQKSTCKRLNMFLRWMVRADNQGVDFGLWRKIKPADLICPCDLHVDRVARKLKLITRKQTDWQTALELTEKLREFDPQDPAKYDFALFGLGIEERWGDGFDLTKMDFD